MQEALLQFDDRQRHGMKEAVKTGCLFQLKIIYRQMVRGKDAVFEFLALSLMIFALDIKFSGVYN